jgi:hypothetical protein
LLVLALLAAGALGPIDAVELTVDGPACADEAAVREAAARYLGRTDLESIDEAILARVEISEARVGFQVDVKVVLPEPHGVTERQLEAADCAEAVDIGGLIVSVALDPLAVTEAVVPVAELEPLAAKAPVSETPAPEGVEAPETSSRFELSLLGNLGLGQHGRLAWGSTLAFAYTAHMWSVGGLLRYWLPQRDPLEADSDAGVRLQSFSAGLMACVTPHQARWVFPSCGGFETGFLQGAGYGLDVDQLTRLPLLAVAFEQGLIWRVGERVGVQLSLGTSLQLLRPKIEVEGAGTVFSRPPVTFRFGIGPNFSF